MTKHDLHRSSRTHLHWSRKTRHFIGHSLEALRVSTETTWMQWKTTISRIQQSIPKLKLSNWTNTTYHAPIITSGSDYLPRVERMSENLTKSSEKKSEKKKKNGSDSGHYSVLFRPSPPRPLFSTSRSPHTNLLCRACFVVPIRLSIFYIPHRHRHSYRTNVYTHRTV